MTDRSMLLVSPGPDGIDWDEETREIAAFIDREGPVTRRDIGQVFMLGDNAALRRLNYLRECGDIRRYKDGRKYYYE